MLFSCLIVDDDPVIVDLLTTHCKTSGKFEDPTVVSRAIDAIKHLNSGRYDVVFLDLNLPDASGKDVLQCISENVQVIMVTSEESFGVESYKFNVSGFLLKPFTFSEFSLMTSKLVSKSVDYMFVKSGTERVRIRFDEILFIKSESNYVTFYLLDKRVMSLMKLGDLAREILPKHFVQIHRSYIVNTNKIDRVLTHNVWVGENELPVSDSHKEGLNIALNAHL